MARYTPIKTPDVKLEGQDNRKIVWFDIDNTLYTKSAGIHELMKDKIQAYFERIGLSKEEATQLHRKYYTQYGLAIRGLVRHHKVDPIDYDKHCDAALPLEEVLHPDAELKRLLQDIDRTKARVLCVTNAYRPHAFRVLNIMQLEDQFEGVVWCDYGIPEFCCKPEAQFFQLAMDHSGVQERSRHYFVDDSVLNVRGAKSFGWGSCVHFDEGKADDEIEKNGPVAGVDATIGDLQGLRRLWKDVF